MKIALIGLGDIAAKAYLPAIALMPDLELVLCTRNAQRLNALGNKYRIAIRCTDFRQLNPAELDAVMIHSSTESHFDLVRYFLEAGLPVFVDKPLVDNDRDCERLYDLAEQKQQPLFLGFNRRYLPIVQDLLPLVGDSDQPMRLLRWEKHRLNQPGSARPLHF